MPKIPENFGRNSNGTARFGFFRPEYSGSPLMGSTDFGRNIPTEIRLSIFNKPVLCPIGTVKRATFFFNLPRNIAELQVETLCCAYYHVCDQLVSQQNTGFNLQCNNVARQVEEKCCPYYRTLIREFGKGIQNGKSPSNCLARFNRKMSLHFPQVLPLICDWSVWHNGSTQNVFQKSANLERPNRVYTHYLNTPIDQ